MVNINPSASLVKKGKEKWETLEFGRLQITEYGRMGGIIPTA